MSWPYVCRRKGVIVGSEQDGDDITILAHVSPLCRWWPIWKVQMVAHLESQRLL